MPKKKIRATEVTYLALKGNAKKNKLGQNIVTLYTLLRQQLFDIFHTTKHILKWRYLAFCSIKTTTHFP